MNKKMLLAVVLAALVLLSGCSLEKIDSVVDGMQTILEVNGEIVTKNEFNYQYNYNYYIESYYAQLMSQLGGDGTVDDAAVLNETVSGFIQSMVLAQKIGEKGFDQFSAEDEAVIAAEAQASYDAMLESIKASDFSSSELTGEALDKAVKATAEQNGYTLDYYLTTAKGNKSLSLLKAAVTENVTVSDAELQAALDEKVAAEKATYASDPAAYGKAANTGEVTYYTPSGYRTIKVISVAKADADALAARIAAGESFDALSDAPVSYVVTNGSTDVEEAIVNAAMALTEKGAVSPVVETENSAVLVQYVDDVPEATADLEFARAQLLDSMIATAKDTAYNAAVNEWISAAKVTTYLERLN